MSTRRATRFDLLFEGGACRIRARAPLVAGGARFDALSMWTDVSGAFDMRGGSERVRSRRTRLDDASVRIPFTAASTYAQTQGIGLRISALSTERLRVELEDDAGVMVLEGQLGAQDGDLLFVPDNLRWLRAGAESAWSRLERAARTLGAPFRATRGAFCLERPLRGLLREALLPEGWRVPDERAAELALQLKPKVLLVRTTARTEPDGVARAGRAFAGEFNAPAGWLRAALAPASSRFATLASRGDEATLAEIVDGESSPWLRADGILLAAGRLMEQQRGRLSERWMERVLEALAVFASDYERQREWGLRLANARRPETLRMLEMAVAGPHARTARAALIAEVIVDFTGAAPELDAHDEGKLAELAEQARRDVPDLAIAIAARACVHARCGEHRLALEAFIRAADHEDRRRSAARWRRRAAELALPLEGPAEAEALLEQALVESDHDPEILVALARVVRQRGDDERAAELLGKLLRGPIQGATHEDALVAAARYHVETGHADRAHPFLARLGPSLGPGVLGEYDEGSGEWSVPDLSLDAALGREESDDEWPTDEPAPNPGWTQLRGRDKTGFEVSPLEDAFPSQIFERPQVESTGVSEGFKQIEFEEAPARTRVGTAADTLRSLLEAVRASGDPEALLEGALEGAIADGDHDAVGDVIDALDRVQDFEGEGRLRARAESWRSSQRDPEDEE